MRGIEGLCSSYVGLYRGYIIISAHGLGFRAHETLSFNSSSTYMTRLFLTWHMVLHVMCQPSSKEGYRGQKSTRGSFQGSASVWVVVGIRAPKPGNAQPVAVNAGIFFLGW